MDKEKEIEEMVMSTYACCTNKRCTTCQEKCYNYYFAQSAIKSGYGNVKQAVKEYKEKLKERAKYKELKTQPNENWDIGFNVIRKAVSKDQIDETYKELYGEE